jgi:hypothetical protein
MGALILRSMNSILYICSVKRVTNKRFDDSIIESWCFLLQLKEITCRFEKIEPLRSGFDTKHQALQSITPNRHSGAPNNYRSGNQQPLTNHQWPVTESKSSVLVGNARGNSPKSKPANSEGISKMCSSVLQIALCVQLTPLQSSTL